MRGIVVGVFDRRDDDLEKIRLIGHFDQHGATHTFDQDLYRAIRPLQTLDDCGNRAELVDITSVRLLDLGVALG